MKSNGYYHFLRGIEDENLRRKVETFYNSLATELETFGISLAQLLQCKLLIVKEDKGRIVGISGVLKGNYTFLVVKDEYQNRKIGTALFRQMIKWAPKSNCDFIMGHTPASYAKINHLWRKMGGRILYTSLLGGREHYLQFLSYNWRGLVWGHFLKILWLVKAPRTLIEVLSKISRVFRST